ncbi:MAG TPA: hypothetical protein DD491_16775 [Halieaceae bacterium]|nr:hypothetical protein [Halieaceae bacterium]
MPRALNGYAPVFTAIRLFLAALFFATAPHTLAAGKIWESDQSVMRKIGRVDVRMEKNFARNAAPGAFVVSAMDRQTSISGIFRGVCSPVVAVDVTLTDARMVDLSRFAETRRGADLPIDATLTAVRESLVEQCEQLQVIRLSFDAINERQRDYAYAGTLTKANSWQLQDGRVATDYDSAYTFSLLMRSPFSPAGVRYEGGCDDKPTLLLEAIYQNNTERAAAKPIGMSDYAFIAPRIASAYASECPGVKQIRYALNPMPEDYRCRGDGDCFLEAEHTPAGEESWAVSTRQFALKEYNNPIADARDMFEVLAAGRFDILADYDGFFRFYFENWFGAYSDMCKAHIENPVGRKIQIVERTYDNGVLIDEDFGAERLIMIESAYADDYDRYFGSAKAWATTYVLNKVMNQQNSARGPASAVFSSFGFLTGTIDQLEGITRDSCRDDKLLTAQTNMISYARKQPAAITGRYATNKEPRIKYGDNGPSAPDFTAELQERRRQAEQAIRQRNQIGTMEDWLQRQVNAQDDSKPRKGPESKSSDASTPPVAAGGVDRAKQFQDREQLVRDQQRRVNAKLQEFQERMTRAGNPGERQAIQQEMQEYFATIQQELQKELQAFDKAR